MKFKRENRTYRGPLPTELRIWGGLARPNRLGETLDVYEWPAEDVVDPRDEVMAQCLTPETLLLLATRYLTILRKRRVDASDAQG